MHEILQKLTFGQRVLDLGARSGSFNPDATCEALIVRLDLDRPPSTLRVAAVQGDGSALPFSDKSFDAVIANHSLEHMTRLNEVLAEIGRVVRPSGSLYIAVPDSTTLSDRLYRWVYHEGGHVNPFRSPDELDEQVRKYVRLSRVGYRDLHSSFGFLRREHFRPRPPRRMWLFCNGHYAAVVLLAYLARFFDRHFHTRLSMYGWAMYYGNTTVDAGVWKNVCVQCGVAQPSDLLPARTLVWRIKFYICPVCGAWNLFSPDETRETVLREARTVAEPK